MRKESLQKEYSETLKLPTTRKKGYGSSDKKVEYERMGKSSSLAYNRRETRDKRPLGRDTDRSWCHLRTSVKVFWSQSMVSWTSAAVNECAVAQSMDPWAANKKAVHQCSGYTSSAPVRVPSQRSPVPSFASVVGQAENFSSCPYAASDAHEPWAATKKALSFSQCGGDTSSCPGPYPTAACPKFHVCQAENFSPCPCKTKLASRCSTRQEDGGD